MSKELMEIVTTTFPQTTFIVKKEPIGLMNNIWRNRDVIVYEIQGDYNYVITEGIDKTTNEKIICVEVRAHWLDAIFAYPKVVTYA